jgi:hypothetical protein
MPYHYKHYDNGAKPPPKRHWCDAGDFVFAKHTVVGSDSPKDGKCAKDYCKKHSGLAGMPARSPFAEEV